MLIRRAQLKDYDQLMALLRQLNPDDPPQSPAHKQVFEQILAARHLALLVAEANGMLVGSCYLNIVVNLTRGARPYALIENVVTDARHRRQGIGRALILHALRLADNAGCYKTMLMTGRKSAEVGAFYLTCGFNADSKQAYQVRHPQ